MGHFHFFLCEVCEFCFSWAVAGHWSDFHSRLLVGEGQASIFLSSSFPPWLVQPMSFRLKDSVGQQATVLSLSPNCAHDWLCDPGPICASVCSSVKWFLLIALLVLLSISYLGFPAFPMDLEDPPADIWECDSVEASFISSPMSVFREYPWLSGAGVWHPRDRLPQSFWLHQHHFPLQAPRLLRAE